MIERVIIYQLINYILKYYFNYITLMIKMHLQVKIISMNRWDKNIKNLSLLGS